MLCIFFCNFCFASVLCQMAAHLQPPPPSFPLSSFKFCEVLAAVEQLAASTWQNLKEERGKEGDFGSGPRNYGLPGSATVATITAKRAPARAHTHTPTHMHTDAIPLQPTTQNCLDLLCFSIIKKGKCCAFFQFSFCIRTLPNGSSFAAPPPSFPLSSFKFCEVLAAAEAACGQHLAKF